MAFPNDRMAAISLTYDDAANELLDHAVPDLDAVGLRGTFYIPVGKCPTWPSRTGDWREAANRGHELGNHTVYHPCSERFNWIKKGHGLESYTLEMIEAELVEASRQLREATGEEIRTYAYTCGDDFVTPQRVSIRPMVGRLFLAARGGGDADASNDPADTDFTYVRSWSIPAEPDAQALGDYVDRIIERGAWGVLQFHGVGGGHRLNVSRAAHQRVLSHIASLKDRLWCDTFVNVASYLKTKANS